MTGRELRRLHRLRSDSLRYSPTMNTGTAVLTGAGRGIGRTIAQTLVREGFRVALCARSRDEIVAAAREVDPGGERTLPVAVFAIHPGVVRTPMNEANIQRPEVRRYVPGFCRMVEEGRVVGPERAAALVLTLASGKHRQLSGQYITIDDPLNV